MHGDCASRRVHLADECEGQVGCDRRRHLSHALGRREERREGCAPLVVLAREHHHQRLKRQLGRAARCTPQDAQYALTLASSFPQKSPREIDLAQLMSCEARGDYKYGIKGK
eukprot:6196521-Pleurochrysis_carterae.AAC.2